MTLLHLYVFLRLGSFPLFRNRRRRLVLFGAGALLWLVFVFGRIYGGNESGALGMILDLGAMHWMGSLFILAVSLLAADLACGFGFLFQKTALHFRRAGLIGGIILVIIAHIQGLRPPVIESYDITVKGLPEGLEGMTVAVLSDMHTGEMMIGKEWLSARINQVMALSPDAVLLAGDLFERGADPDGFTPIMRRLSAPMGVWAVRGNHDTRRPGRRDVTGEILNCAGIRLLENEWAMMFDGLAIAGIDDLTSSRRRPGEGAANIASALAHRPPAATVFLSHTPWMTDQAAAAGVDLMISGHTHNGQIWPFTYLVRNRYSFIHGLYTVNGMNLLVSRGTGTWGPRMRLWSPGEISLVTLRAASEPLGNPGPFH